MKAVRLPVFTTITGMTSESPSFQINLIIAAILRGETDKFRLIVREYGLTVRGYLATRLHHQEEVEDLAQEVFLIVYDKLGSYEPGNFGAWIIGIARNQLRNHWRTRARREDAMERFREELDRVVGPVIEAEAECFSPGEIERLLHCISLLPDRLRHIVRAGLDGARATALAAELGINANALYQARFRAHAALRKCMRQPSPRSLAPSSDDY